MGVGYPVKTAKLGRGQWRGLKSGLESLVRWENLNGLEGWATKKSKVGPACGCGQRSLREHEEGGTAVEGPRDPAQCIWVFYKGDMTRLGGEAGALAQ